MKRIPSYAGPYRVDPQPALSFSGELIVDLFAGGGGASTGMEWALGRSPDIAVNHDPEAVALHQVNHPHTLHFCESVFDVVPQEVCAGRSVGDLWMSPDCTHHSKARGSKPVSKRVRGLAWVGKRWAATVRPKRIYLENVEEFKDWGPLVRVNGEWRPCKKRSGRTFRNFVRELKRLGYDVDWRELKASDFGAPTIRKRLFLVARCDGHSILWPEFTHGDPQTASVKSGQLLPWRTAAECIDWDIPCPSIFTRKRPLVENTLRRVAKGIRRYVIESPAPFIVPVGRKGRQVMTAPSLTEHANSSMQRTFSVDEPLRTQCAQVKGGHFALQSAMLLKHYGGVVGTPLTVPAGTVTATDHHGIAAAHLVRHFGEGIGSPLDAPVGTVMPGGMGKTGVVAASLVRNFGKSFGASPSAPHATITGKSKDSLVTSNLVKMYGTCKAGQPTDKPMATVTANGRGGGHIAEVRAFLLKYYGADQAPHLQEPLHTITTRDRFGLVTVNRELYQIVDIGMRMLAPRELYRAQGFPDSYIIDYVLKMVQEKSGLWVMKKVRLTATAQVRMCGNSVSPYVACAVVQANTRKQLREAA